MSESVSTQGHEERDINFNAVVLFVISLVVFLLLVHFVATRLFHRFASERPNHSVVSPLAATHELLPGPRLLVNQAVDMDKLRTSEQATLNSYGWVDRDHGVVHIPIERAMEMLTKEQ